MTYEPKQQIAYVPQYAEGDINHPGVEFGFVVKATVDGKGYYCCYFYKKPLTHLLRTTANAEYTPSERIVAYNHRNQTEIDALYDAIPPGFK